MVKKILIIQTSLNKTGTTQKIASYCYNHIKENHSGTFEVEFLNLLDEDNEFCDGSPIEKYSDRTQEINKIIIGCDLYILASPVYNNSVSGVCKNFLDIHSKVMSEKYVALVENAGEIYSIKKPYEMLKDYLEFYKINLIDVVINTTLESFSVQGELIDKLSKENLDRILTEFKNVTCKNKSMPEVE